MSMLNIKNTTDGYLKDVEIKGNTIQDAENLADIRSVGDKVEGQELYEIPVVSSGKNLFDGKLQLKGLDGTTGAEIDSSTHSITNLLYVGKNKNFILSGINGISWVLIHEYDKDGNQVNRSLSQSNNSIGKFSTTTGGYIKIRFDGTPEIINSYNIQLEEGTVATPYEPYQGDKLTILSPVQLEKVGDVADRIICKDGVWRVEKNIYTGKNLSELNWTKSSLSNSDYTIFCVYGFKPNTSIICNIFSYSPNIGEVSPKQEGINIIGDGSLRISISTNTCPDIASFKEYLFNNKCFIKYIGDVVEYKLPHDQQVKLRTFAGQTNIHFETEIEPTLKAQVPKSIGATVNSHTEQICNLSKELDRVKKLEESTVSTVTTEIDFTTVEETSNGYFEDVKLEGKTLVNVLSPKYHSVGAAWGTDEKTFILDIVSGSGQPMILGKFNQGLKRDTKYTAIVNVLSYTHGMPHFCFMNKENNKVTTQQLTLMSSGLHKLVFTTNADSDSYYFRILPRNGVDNKYSIDRNIIILEGDHTQNPPEYFEGLMSVGQDVDEVSVESENNGYFDLTSMMKPGNIDSNTGKPNEDYGAIRSTEFIGVIPNRTYKAINNLYTNCRFFYYTKNKEYIGCSSVNTSNIVVPNGCYFIRVRIIGTDITSTTIVKAINGVDREYQSNKKPLLYYNNETQTWEKPVLRQWDSIEKHSDGKYYYHKRSEEVVLNGSENWYKTMAEQDIASSCFQINIVGKKHGYGVSMCDKFLNTCNNQPFTPTGVKEFTYTDHPSLDTIYMNYGTDNSTSLVDWKAWLQANPTTVVYQLAEEKVYECTNLDLITYEGETNYIINSGAIAPKSVLKVHNNISNVVKILQEKVNLLESNVIASQEVQDMMILESDIRILDIELALMEHMPIKLNLGENIMLRSATYFNFLKNHIINETYEKEYLENVMNKYLATGRINQDEYDELYKLLYPPVYDIELPIEY